MLSQISNIKNSAYHIPDHCNVFTPYLFASLQLKCNVQSHFKEQHGDFSVI